MGVRRPMAQPDHTRGYPTDAFIVLVTSRWMGLPELFLPGVSKEAGLELFPIGLVTRRGARVARQHGPLLRAGSRELKGTLADGRRAVGASSGLLHEFIRKGIP